MSLGGGPVGEEGAGVLRFWPLFLFSKLFWSSSLSSASGLSPFSLSAAASAVSARWSPAGAFALVPSSKGSPTSPGGLAVRQRTDPPVGLQKISLGANLSLESLWQQYNDEVNKCGASYNCMGLPSSGTYVEGLLACRCTTTLQMPEIHKHGDSTGSADSVPASLGSDHDVGGSRKKRTSSLSLCLFLLS